MQEARVVASQDVPAEQLDARVSDWALQASVGSAQSRVAALLGATLRSDPGQPAQLALGDAHPATALAANEVVPAPAQGGELPALDAAPAFAQVEAPEPAQPVTQLASYEPAARSVWTDAVAMPGADRSPVAQRAPKPAKSQASRKVGASAVNSVANRRTGTHVVQLGSFSSEEGAKRAWNLFVRRDASLKGREMRITQATVNGRRFWRVAAAGYDANAARTKCSTVRGQGKECLAYAGGNGPFRPRVLMAVAERN